MPSEDRKPLCDEEAIEPAEPLEEIRPSRGACYRYLALFHMCVIGFGSSFVFDNPGALQDNIISDLSLSTTQFSYLYSVYNWPNVILCFIGGFLIDRVFGIKLGTVLYAAIVVIGHLIFAVGGFTHSFWVMLLGRFIFGIGGESLAVAQNYYAVMWFKGKELNMVFGLQLSLSRIGSAVNFLTMGSILRYVEKYVPEYESIGVILLIATITCVASLVSSLFLAFMSQDVDSNEPLPEDQQVAQLSDVVDFPISFWIVCFICIVYYLAIFPFIALGKVFFERKYDMTADEANGVTSFIYIVAAVASPLLGLLIDKAGRNVLFVTIAILITLGSHCVLGFTAWKPFYAVLFLGLSYSLLASALWPLIALVIPDYQIGSAYGVAQALQNTGLAGATLLAGKIVDQGGYYMLEVFFVMCLFNALAAALLLWICDLRGSGILNMTVPQREAYMQFVAREEQARASCRSSSVGDILGDEVTQPQSSFTIRNRYLSKLGATSVPTHLADLSKQFVVLRSHR